MTSEETAGDLMTIQEAKWETRLAIWQQHIHLNAFLEHSEIEISLF